VRLTRVYTEGALAAGSELSLTGSAAAHVSRVLRLRAGDALTLFNGSGGESAGTILSSKGGTVTVAVGEAREPVRESPLRTILAQGVSRGERMDLTVQKATELGVSLILPVLTERSVVRLDAQQTARKLGHWRKIAVAACEQCGRNRLPEITAPVSLKEMLRTDLKASTHLLLSPEATLRVAELPRPTSGVTVLIGPEGGLTDEEDESVRAAGFLAVRLGPRVLRTETAALAALALLQREFGDF
jgi:16S rRNA (uracil1498-N3)-methyltransferase